MTWDAYHRRKSALREILAVADRHRDEVDAVALLDLVPQAHDAFDTPEDLLRELQMTWFQQLSGALDRAGAEGPVVDSETAALDAWTAAAVTVPGVRRLLDRAGDDPALAVGLANERRLMAASAGRRGASAIEDGERLRAVARARTELPASGADDDASRGLIARLRQALVA